MDRLATLFDMTKLPSAESTLMNTKPGERQPMDQFSAHLDRGWDLVNRGDFLGAQMSAEKSLEIDEKSPEAHNLLGYIQAAQGNAEEALEHYQQALALDDTFMEAMLNAAELLIHPINDYEAAVGMVEEALDLAQDADELADALLIKFDAHMHQADREASAQVAARLPAGPFENSQLDFLVGRAKFEVGDVDGAETLIRRAAKREPEDPDARYYLGLIADARGRHEEASSDFLRSRELDLRHPLPVLAIPAEQFERKLHEVVQDLAPEISAALRGTLFVVSDVPGIEVVVEGVDPRAELLFEDISEQGQPPHIGRVFVYKRNIERIAADPSRVDEEIRRAVEREIVALFPDIAGSGEDGSH
jgi:Flp pilus assembly protein TadD